MNTTAKTTITISTVYLSFNSARTPSVLIGLERNHQIFDSTKTRFAETRLETFVPPMLDFYAIAPHAGARIETCLALMAAKGEIIAPHAGARIETSLSTETAAPGNIAPHAGARIETTSASQ